MKCSIYIPVFNTESLITRALDSIPRRDDIEVIVCDDGSSDSSLDVLMEYKEKNNLNMRVMWNPRNMGEVIEKIRKEWKKKKLKKTFSPVKCVDEWDKYLDHSPTTYRQKFYKVRATDISEKFNVMDIELGRVPKTGEEWVVDNERLPRLLSSPWGQIAEVVNEEDT